MKLPRVAILHDEDTRVTLSLTQTPPHRLNDGRRDQSPRYVGAQLLLLLKHTGNCNHYNPSLRLTLIQSHRNHQTFLPPLPSPKNFNRITEISSWSEATPYQRHQPKHTSHSLSAVDYRRLERRRDLNRPFTFSGKIQRRRLEPSAHREKDATPETEAERPPRGGCDAGDWWRQPKRKAIENTK